MQQGIPTPRDFEPHLRQPMRFGGITLTLGQVEVRSDVSFSLILQGPTAPVLMEGLHEAELGERSFGALYVSPIHTPEGTRQDYQVVFNGLPASG